MSRRVNGASESVAPREGTTVDDRASAPGSSPAVARHASTYGVIATLIVYTGFVSALASRHELWRDEVRALSIATGSPSVASLLGELHTEGHPAAWFLLLRAAATAAGTTHVLHGVSIAVACVAVLLLVKYAPFGWPAKLVFAFGGVAAYEYSVMARNYGLSMLALFAWAILYPARDGDGPGQRGSHSSRSPTRTSTPR
jgi:hypothetical protein